MGFGRALGREVVKLASSLQSVVVETPSLEVRESAPAFRLAQRLNNPLVRAAYSFAFFPELVANFADEYADGIRPRLTVALLNGEIALVGASRRVLLPAREPAARAGEGGAALFLRLLQRLPSILPDH